jgi:hypothetical protein
MAKQPNVSQVLDTIQQHATLAPDAAALVEQRSRFVAKVLSDLPADVAGELGTDPTKWNVEAGRIRLQYRIDQGLASPLELMNAGMANNMSQNSGGPLVFTMPAPAKSPTPPSGVDLIRQALQPSPKRAGQ